MEEEEDAPAETQEEKDETKEQVTSAPAGRAGFLNLLLTLLTCTTKQIYPSSFDRDSSHLPVHRGSDLLSTLSRPLC